MFIIVAGSKDVCHGLMNAIYAETFFNSRVAFYPT